MVSKACILSELQLLWAKEKISSAKKWRKMEFLHAIVKFTHFLEVFLRVLWPFLDHDRSETL